MATDWRYCGVRCGDITYKNSTGRTIKACDTVQKDGLLGHLGEMDIVCPDACGIIRHCNPGAMLPTATVHLDAPLSADVDFLSPWTDPDGREWRVVGWKSGGTISYGELIENADGSIGCGTGAPAGAECLNLMDLSCCCGTTDA